MFRITRPIEPGTYALEFFDGETIHSVTFSNQEYDCVQIVMSSGLVFSVFVTEAGQLDAAVIDPRVPKDHKGH